MAAIFLLTGGIIGSSQLLSGHHSTRPIVAASMAVPDHEPSFRLIAANLALQRDRALHPAPAPSRPTPPPVKATPRFEAATGHPSIPVASSSWTCATAVAYLATHAAPGFQFECPGYALGHQAMTCVDVAGVCPGTRLIVIAVLCPATWMNEASNSWVLVGLRSGPIDPYGYC